MPITAIAPTRIDLAGGTLDLWPIQYLLDHKATVNIGITLPAQVTINESSDGYFHITSQDQATSIEGSLQSVCETKQLPLIGLLVKALWHEKLPPLTIATSAKSPAGAGLGGSSCLGVTLAASLLAARRAHEELADKTDEELVRLVQDVEARLIHAPTGSQDYWGAIRGNVNILRFPFGGTDVQTLHHTRIDGLADNLIICYSGKSRASALNNWGVFKHVFDGDLNLIARLEEIGELAEECGNAIVRGDLARALEVSQKEWVCRKKLWPSIETRETKQLDLAAREAGARFTRVCGAGGGGVMAVFAPPTSHESVKDALIDNGGIILDAQIATTGLVVNS